MSVGNNKPILQIESTARVPFLGEVQSPYTPHNTQDNTQTASQDSWYHLNPDDRWLIGKAYLVAKRCMDLALVLIALPCLLLLMLLCALLIKLESPDGPIFFVQQRTGKNGKRFAMYKFRTMVPNAEELKADLSHLNEREWPDFKITNDPRITHIGRLLRKTSLDELPQIFNILKGEMSLVGPRPTSFPADTYEAWQQQRLSVQPGLTGLWQVEGRTCTEFDYRVALDIAYIKRRSILLDVLILAHTCTVVLKQKGAY